MRLNGNQLVKKIRKYQDEGRGIAWSIFWDYKKGIEKRGGNIFSDECLALTSMHLFIYLCCFGMARSPTGLTNSDLDVFTNMIKNIKDNINRLSTITFEKLDKSHRSVINSNCHEISKKLRGVDISGSRTMVTKILMACWGQTPAYDTRFVSAYRKYVKRLPGDYFESLCELKREYETSWKKDILTLGSKYRKTKAGGCDIPHARLIDMAFWELGSDD